MLTEKVILLTEADVTLPLQLYIPDGTPPFPVYVYLHGGSWWLGDGGAAAPYCQNLAAATGSIVAVADYRLAPEFPFPAALDDCCAALSWCAEGQYGIDPERVVIGGASAGGNLAAAAMLRLRDEGVLSVRLQVLEMPILDPRLDTPSMLEHGGDRYSTSHRPCREMDLVSWLTDQQVESVCRAATL